MNYSSEQKRIIIGLLIVLGIGMGISFYNKYLRPVNPINVFDTVPTLDQVVQESDAKAVSANEVLIVCHVTGEVRRPGVYQVCLGSRVVDALLEAGGMTTLGDPEKLNLSAEVKDGQKIVVPPKHSLSRDYDRGEDKTTVASNKSRKPININTADQSTLEGLPSVGPSLARKIIAYREKNGKFRSPEDLDKVQGIGSKMLGKLTPLITF